VAAVLEEPPPELRFRRTVRLGAALRDLVHARGLVLTLTERELRVRYKQALLGLAWALVTPVFLMIVFTVFFQRVARVDTQGAPYPLFSYLGLIPWAFFSTSVSQGAQSLVANMSLLNKVYCPREVFPLASVMVAGIDSLISSALAAVLVLAYGIVPGLTVLWVPALLAVQVAFSLGVALVASVLGVYLRDIRHALPLALQLGLFATPVAFGLDAVPPALRTAYVALNPLGAVIDGYRRTVLLGRPPQLGLLLVAAISSVVVLAAGYRLFKRLEPGLADVA
jgi:ABC-type polysaccharide/polyol phosphate export permease